MIRAALAVLIVTLAYFALVFLVAYCVSAHAQTGCVPNPNLTGPPYHNGCPIDASALNNIGRLGTVNIPSVQASDFGATCNGSTSDTAAFAAAVAAIPLGAFRSYYVPPLCTATMTPPLGKTVLWQFGSGGAAPGRPIVDISGSTAGGVWGAYGSKAAAQWYEQTNEDMTGSTSPEFRTGLFLESQDVDTHNYTSVAQKVNQGLWVYTQGPVSGGAYQSQYKDEIGIYSFSATNSQWSARGASAYTGDSYQYGIGIASNEFAVHNPSSAAGQSVSMAAVQGIVDAQKGAADSSHLYNAFLATNTGLGATAAYAANGPGSYGALLDGTNTPVSSTGNGINMPPSDAGSRIMYRANAWTDYIASTGCYRWNVAGLEVARFCGNGAVMVDVPFQLATLTVGALPTCNSGSKYYEFSVSDLVSAPAYRQTALTGGGSVAGKVFCNGAAWEAH